MRWSLFSLVSLFALLIADVTALPTPQHGSSDLVLERRVVTKPKKMSAGTFKKSSSTYRKAAMKSTNPMFSVKNGKITKSKAPKTMPKGKDAGACLCISIRIGFHVFADHIFEAQTMNHAAKKAGHSLKLVLLQFYSFML